MSMYLFPHAVQEVVERCDAGSVCFVFLKGVLNASLGCGIRVRGRLKKVQCESDLARDGELLSAMLE